MSFWRKLVKQSAYCASPRCQPTPITRHCSPTTAGFFQSGRFLFLGHMVEISLPNDHDRAASRGGNGRPRTSKRVVCFPWPKMARPRRMTHSERNYTRQCRSIHINSIVIFQRSHCSCHVKGCRLHRGCSPITRGGMVWWYHTFWWYQTTTTLLPYITASPNSNIATYQPTTLKGQVSQIN